MGLFVQFGAGNIGRSFIARLFSEAGFAVVFVDVDAGLVDRLNQRRSYPVIVKQSGQADLVRQVVPVRAILASETRAVIEALVAADYAGTAVGPRALESVLPLLAQGLLARSRISRPPLDLILAENLRGAAEFCRDRLGALLAGKVGAAALEDLVGLVATSIGKMVPLMPAAALAADPLQLFAEAYDTLIVDRSGFRGPLPPLVGLEAVPQIAAYVDRKLFLHNMSHAAAAYLGFQADPRLRWLWQVMDLPTVVLCLEAALGQAAAALASAYPGVFTVQDLVQHGTELLARYRNRALGDTLHRVGRDLGRKLARDDRLVGTCLLAASQGLPFTAIAPVVAAALHFRAPDERGQVLPADQALFDRLEAEGPTRTLSALTGLDPANALEGRVLAALLEAIAGQSA